MEQIHPLPALLAAWQPTHLQDDYFDQIQPSIHGYLIWSEFPVGVYIESKTWSQADGPLATQDQGRNRSQRWYDAVLQAIADWNQYLPLTIVDAERDAGIVITEGAPTLQTAMEPFSLASTPHRGTVHSKSTTDIHPVNKAIGHNPSVIVGQRARTAETQYDLYLERLPSEKLVLRQRYHIAISPHQTPLYAYATALHEIGHALGLWGHSLADTDALYFSQVRSPQGLSERDLNTLKRLYQQPTALGWPFPIPAAPDMAIPPEAP